MNRTETQPTYSIAIYMAGDISQARQVCREFCYEVGLCVTISPTDYIYTGGEEAGFRIGLINYPRFPSTPDDLWAKARALATRLRDRLCQHSLCLVGPDRTEWSTRRPSHDT